MQGRLDPFAVARMSLVLSGKLSSNWSKFLEGTKRSNCSQHKSNCQMEPVKIILFGEGATSLEQLVTRQIP